MKQGSMARGLTPTRSTCLVFTETSPGGVEEKCLNTLIAILTKYEELNLEHASDYASATKDMCERSVSDYQSAMKDIREGTAQGNDVWKLIQRDRE